MHEKPLVFFDPGQNQSVSDRASLRESFVEGRLLRFDKPLKWTSFDVVNKIRSLLRHRLGIKKIKVGHAGTLDPLATGLLIICTGAMTRRIDSFQAMEKQYSGSFRLGMTTPSFDLETEPDSQFPYEHIDEALLHTLSRQFTGEQYQMPPQFSARKIDGKRAYSFARRGEHTQLEPRQIHIHEFAITRIALPDVYFRVRCSKGTYIRSLAHDFGKAAGSGAYLQSLRREAIGNVSVEGAWLPDAFEKYLLT